ncbi:MAG: hypothetical protein E7Z96_07850 [Actinomycetaceae bacterium]|nr:hypothetical protein [Actinomycetaceae bacterium]
MIVRSPVATSSFDGFASSSTVVSVSVVVSTTAGSVLSTVVGASVVTSACVVVTSASLSLPQAAMEMASSGTAGSAMSFLMFIG